MELYRGTTANQTDYNDDGRGPKSGKLLSNTDERLDSGLDSLKEDNLPSLEECRITDFVGPTDEPWKKELTEDGDTYLHLAIIHEATDAALKMIALSRRDPFLNIQNNQRQTALHLAIITDQPLIVEQLLKAGCDASLVDDHGNTALHIACRKGSLACFGLLTQGCSQHLSAILQTPNYNGQKCIHVVAIQGYLSLLESLIQLGADINAQEQCNGRTALHLAVDLQNFDMVKLLIEKGASVHSVTYGGHTPYHLTYGRSNADIQKVLYELTSPHLRELPESDSEDSEDSDEDYEERCQSEVEDLYDDIKVMGQ
ncbi:nuclear factor of kappa light polypeptide gene enhancer in B-cells inhibitor, alpha b [Danio rerio]|uniref:NF-kappa-B inhibitor alpha n=1 Tax=Danio rerio TaxID=7955 RepID=Q7ZW68_DANRE|nr:nuclear factor of kappa light polypeptide gene enhancer in B-cells inhibitor, alpha b [Danio rerio]AAH50175.1 Nuclear factor of kappa light polypeptide gene enhancer in B-cells inhibitor, alpha b [Danio rerio]AAH62524.1 Nuclear factor of kappa light polypeptide gene enhancer in B-cells inhibitor, alpha b [Danio rerio]|eukprot:NP_955923.1 NF-kappa-B inhibitor alpha [Danio rerio]